MMATKEQDIQDTLSVALDLMKKAGADYADASYSSDEQRGVTIRNGIVESLEASKSMSIALMMRIGDKSEETEIGSRSAQDLSDAVTKLAAALRLKPDNEFDRPLDSSELSRIRTNRSLDLVDSTKFSTEAMIAQARRMEDAALAVPKVVNSEGSTAVWMRMMSTNLDSRGDRFSSEKTKFMLGVSVIAAQGQEQQTDGEHSGAVYYQDLWRSEDIGRIAGLNAARSLRPRKGKPGKFPVVFHPDVGAGLLGSFASAIQGESIRKKMSFLTEAMGQAVFAPDIRIIDNPHLKRGMASSRYSGSGLPTKPMTLVENGVLKAWFLDLENARRLGLEQTAHIRGKSNLTIEPGLVSPNELISDIQDGLYVTGLMGQGVNLISGAYSRAAKGFWIKNGKVDYDHPVDKLSMSSNLAHMFKELSAANDLNRFRSKVAVPTLRVESMSIA